MSKRWKWKNKKGKYRSFFIGLDFIEYQCGNHQLGLSWRTNAIFKESFRADWFEIHFWFGTLIFHYLRKT